jgi:hypothetical protein
LPSQGGNAGLFLTTDGSTLSWAAAGGGGGGVTSFSAGTTGFLPSASTTGAVTLSGSLNVANGGTGATTAAAALTNLLPAQGPNAGKVLGTDGTTASWVTAGGTYTATAPVVVTGTVVSLNLGLGVAANGTNLAFKMPVLPTPPAAGSGAIQAFDGSMYWDNSLGQLFVRYNDGTTTQWVAAAPPGGGGSSVTAASLAEAAAGTINTKFLSPQTGVPKDASGMTGAALMPGGVNTARPATPVKGMLRYNDQGGGDANMEYYDGSNWVVLASGGPLNADPQGWFGHSASPD